MHDVNEIFSKKAVTLPSLPNVQIKLAIHAKNPSMNTQNEEWLQNPFYYQIQSLYRH
jgi:hypothetical protein